MKLSHKSIKKIGVYFILAIFLLSTAMMSAMYFVDMQSKSADAAQAAETGSTTTVSTGSVGTGA
jgi:hypothetical protein